VDTPIAESNAPLSVNQAAALFSAPKEPEKQQPEAQAEEAAPVEAEESPEATQAEANPEKAEAAPEVTDEIVTIQVDGKPVELKKSELADYYKNGLRQADYTRKTMETAEQRKAAEAEASKAREERQKYAAGLQHAQAVLLSQLNDQSQINWHQLREDNPQEFLKQWHLFSERQAKLQQLQGQNQQLQAIELQEAKRNLVSALQKEHQAVLDKLPEWKDEKKALAEKQAIAKELIDRGFPEQMVFGERDPDGAPNLRNPGLADHRILLMARDAMLYRQMMGKAKEAAAKVTNLPQKVERPGGGEVSALDGRTAAMKRLGQTGSVRDAAAVFASLRKS
jgi:hypothetical protein